MSLSRILTEQNTFLCSKRICSRQTRVSRCWWQLPTSPNIMCRKHRKYTRKESRKFRALVEENDESKNVWKPNWRIIATCAIKKDTPKNHMSILDETKKLYGPMFFAKLHSGGLGQFFSGLGRAGPIFYPKKSAQAGLGPYCILQKPAQAKMGQIFW